MTMAMAFDPSLLDFNLDFLHEPSNNDLDYVIQKGQHHVLDHTSVKTDTENGISQSCMLQKKSNTAKKKGLNYLKRRIIQTSEVIEQFHARGDQIAQLQKNLIDVKNKCKEAYIERDADRQKCEDLQKECEWLRTQNRELNQKDGDSKTKQLAEQSLTRQLQQLVAEREDQLYKEKENIKNLEKQVGSLQRHKDYLIKYLTSVADVLINKNRNLNKREKKILSKYLKLKNHLHENTLHKELNSGKQDDMLDIFSMEDNAEQDRSLPQSDNEQHIDEMLDSTICNNNGFASSKPLTLDKSKGSSVASLGRSTNHDDSKPNEKQLFSTASTTAVKPTVDRATSPIISKINSSKDKDTIMYKDTATSPIRNIVSNIDSIDGIEPLSSTSEKRCLELNNSNNFVTDDAGDCEVERILNTMRLSVAPVTPIPPTPARSVAARAIETQTTELSISSEGSGCVQECIRNGVDDYTEIKSTIKVLAEDLLDVKKTLKQLTNNICIVKQPVTHSNVNITNISSSEGNIYEEQSSENIISEATQNLRRVNKDLPMNIAELLQFEDSNSSKIENNCNSNTNLEPETDLINTCLKEKNKLKSKKLTQLEKLRKNMIPKSKIRKSDVTPSRKLRSRVKLIVNTNNNNLESAASLNDKYVYEKAVKVMAELNSKSKKSTSSKIITKRNYFSNSTLKENYNTSKISNDKNSADDNTDLVDSRRLSTDKYRRLTDNSNDIVATQLNVNSLRSSYQVNNRRRNSSQNNVDTVPPTSIRSDSLGLEKNLDTVSPKSPKSYPSLMKDAVVVLTRSKIDTGLKDLDTNVARSPENIKRRNNSVPAEKADARILRSTVRCSKDERQECDDSNKRKENCTTSSFKADSSYSQCNLVRYDDLDLFSDKPPPKKQKRQDKTSFVQNPEESILCKMIEKYGTSVLKTSHKKVPESVVKTIHKRIEENIAHIIELPQMKSKDAMNKMIEEMQKWSFREFLLGLMHYLTDPARKIELFNKINVPPAPPMTKSEQVLLYLVTQATWNNIQTIDAVLNQIEYTLFRLNQTPDFEVIESMSHFYAILCRYIKAKSRLRLFIIDAMYCIQYKAVPIIKQCMEVWMHILPLAHMGIAKSTLVTCMVYLMHFYKCEDKFNRVQEIRDILKKKYSFHISDWNEPKLLEMFKNAILELRNNSMERKMLRLALILLAKRHGPKWCQSKLIKGILMPIITTKDISEKTQAFCLSMLGALLKPYPLDMKVHCEITVNQLVDMLDNNPSPIVEEAIYGSLIRMSRHNQNRVIQALLLWQPKQVSSEMESMLRDYVKEKPVRVWKAILSKISLVK